MAQNVPKLITTMSNGPHALVSLRIVERTRATEPSPKLESTPAGWISASGQIWRTIPAMNVPWPASKSSSPERSSSGSSSSSIASIAGFDCQPSCRWTCGQSRSGPRRNACSGWLSPSIDAVRKPVSRTRTRGRRWPSRSQRLTKHRGSGRRLGGRDQRGLVLRRHHASVGGDAGADAPARAPPSSCGITELAPKTTWLSSAADAVGVEAGELVVESAQPPRDPSRRPRGSRRTVSTPVASASSHAASSVLSPSTLSTSRGHPLAACRRRR